MNERINKLFNIMDDTQRPEAFLVTGSESRVYFSGFTGSNAALLISESGNKLFTDFRYIRQAQTQSPDFEIIDAGGELFSTVAKEIRSSGFGCVAFEAEAMYSSDYLRLAAIIHPVRLIDVSRAITFARAVKSAEEIKSIRHAVKIADDAFTHVLKYMKEGVSEFDIAAELEYYIKKCRAGISFSPIIAGGSNGAMPHADISDRKFKDGDLVVMDFGAKACGYCSDMTRTVAIGEIGAKAEKIYDIVLEAQLAAVSSVKPGAGASEIDRIARDVICRAGFGSYFGHGLGHGVGLAVHEAPTLNPSSRDVLLPGMVFSIEPGIYLPGDLGVRIEDLCLMTRYGCELLTASPKALIKI